MRQRHVPGGADAERSGRTRSSTCAARRPARAEGYRGFFEVDVLVDLDTDEVYLGELNPRISGASSMTNVTAGAYADMPLFLFHLLEYMDVDYDARRRRDQRALARAGGRRRVGQLIMKEPDRPASSGSCGAADRALAPRRRGTLTSRASPSTGTTSPHENERFFLRVYGPGDYRFKGADLGVLVTKGRMQTAEGLTPRCRRYIEGIRAHVRQRAPRRAARAGPDRLHK